MTTTDNELLRAARHAAGLTQDELAERANVQVEAATGRMGGMDADYIGKLERGKHRWPNKAYRDALRSVLGAAADRDLGFYSTRSRAATVGSGPRYRDGGNDVERQAFLRVLTGSVTGLAFVDPLSGFAAAATAGKVGQAEVEHVRQLAQLFADQDHQYGGQLSARAVVAQLSTTAELTNASFANSQVKADLFSAVAELADLAAGMCFDAGLHSHAEKAFRFSVGCASESGDWSMRAKALSGLANLHVHQGRTDDALSFAEMALVRVDRLAPKTQAVMHTRHARALGLVGAFRAADCRTAVSKAEDAYAKAIPGDGPTWLAYYDQAHLDRDAGRALLHLALNGEGYTHARQRLEDSIARFPAGFSRGKALAKANLAHLVMACGDPREAATLGHEALESVGSVRSDRVNDALRKLVHSGQRNAHTPEVADLLKAAAHKLGTTHSLG